MMKIILLCGFILLPCAVFAAENCQVVEFSDHFEVSCTGDAKPVSIPRQAVVSAPLQESAQSQTPEQQHAPQQADTATAAAPGADAAKAAPPSTPYAKGRGRQGRPNSADWNAAIEARRKLILEQRPAATAAPNSGQ